MYYHCVNDKDGYCSGEPTLDVEPGVDEHGIYRMSHCKHDPEKCKKFQTLIQSLERQFSDTKARVKDWPQDKHFVKQLAEFEKVKKEAAIKGIA